MLVYVSPFLKGDSVSFIYIIQASILSTSIITLEELLFWVENKMSIINSYYTFDSKAHIFLKALC